MGVQVPPRPPRNARVTAAGCDLTRLVPGRLQHLSLRAPLAGETYVGLVVSTLLHDLISQAFDRANRRDALCPRLLVLLEKRPNPAAQAPDDGPRR